ncbi:MAG TPA: pseudouridine-5'-phosphate glycosidase [Candidatus Ozemobacteraceae bacterium]|nr:pseudouridine-5'-phosphate glycosidase [Candidatus Ozemobacteraceae bacterium]
MKLDILPEIREALAARRPVVALESTIIAHGMPYPENLKTAQLLEATVRENGAVPATIAIIGGVWKIGLSPADLEFLATAKEVRKASRMDLGGVLSRGLHAAVTVCGTMIGADLAGIRIFATGGIGGVHRGATQTFDISADLDELGRTRVAVVSAGAKAILDLPLTLEYLETKGVPVVGYGTSELPAFYTRESGLKLVERVDTPEQAAALLHAHWQVPHSGGVLIANPIPSEAALPRALIDGAIEEALKQAQRENVAGKALTPFLLGALGKITAGASLTANIALVKHNAAVSARIATALSAHLKATC